VPAEIRRHDCRSRNITESVTATFGRNRKYAESVKIYSFGAETETEIRSNISMISMFTNSYNLLINHTEHALELQR